MKIQELLTLGLICLLLGALPACETTDDDDSSDVSPGDDDDDVTPGDDDDVTPDDDDDSVLEISIAGDVTRSIEPALDGIGTLRVRVLASPPPNAEVAAVFELKEADLSTSNSSVPYELGGIPVRDEPYEISAVLDDDGSGGRPDENDLRMAPRLEMTFDEDVGQITLDLVLNAYGGQVIPGDDDDSAGDDDDSAGDDDDSAGQ